MVSAQKLPYLLDRKQLVSYLDVPTNALRYIRPYLHRLVLPPSSPETSIKSYRYPKPYVDLAAEEFSRVPRKTSFQTESTGKSTPHQYTQEELLLRSLGATEAARYAIAGAETYVKESIGRLAYDGFMTVAGTTNVYNVSDSTVTYWHKGEVVNTVKDGGTLLVPVDEFRRVFQWEYPVTFNPSIEPSPLSNSVIQVDI